MKNKKLLGTLFVVLGAVSWSFGGVLCKLIPWSGVPMSGFRSLFSALLYALIIRRGFKVKLTRYTCLGAVGVAATGLLYIMAAKRTSAANAIVLQYCMPIFVILFTWIFQHKRPSKRDVITCAFILLGVILCSWNGLGNGHITGDLLAIAAGVSFALVFFCSKLPGANAQDYNYLGFALGALPALTAFGGGVTAVPMHWVGLIGMAVCLTMGYYFIARGMEHTEPITAALLANLEPVLNPLWVLLFLGEDPGVMTYLGAAVVLTSATVYSISGLRNDA